MSSTVVLIREERFIRTPDGRVWSRWGTGEHTWLPFLSAFSEIALVARVQEAAGPPAGGTLVSHDRVRIWPVTYFQGPREYLKRARSVNRDLNRYVSTDCPVVLRIPSPLANMLRRKLIREQRPFAVEVAGDPYDQMSPGAMQHPLRPYFRWRFTAAQHSFVQSARVVKYVTRSALQRRYPAPRAAAVHAISDVFLPPEAFCFKSRQRSNEVRLVFVGMLEQLYKGPDTLLEAVAIAINQGVRLSVAMVGDGQHRPMLEQMARKLNIAHVVNFLGARNATGVRQVLDDSDVFVLPSRQEGLPRAMVEAMARALPCIGTNVGGIPELIEPEFLVRPNDAVQLATKLSDVAANPGRLAAAGERNYRTSQEYALPIRFQRETEFAHDVLTLCR